MRYTGIAALEMSKIKPMVPIFHPVAFHKFATPGFLSPKLRMSLFEINFPKMNDHGIDPLIKFNMNQVNMYLQVYEICV